MLRRCSKLDKELVRAAHRGDTELVKEKIKSGANVHFRDTCLADIDPLKPAAKYGHIDIVKALIEAHADVNIKNGYNDTALHFALKNGHIDIAKALIEAHADGNIKNGDNDTALHIALKNGHFDIAKALIEAHADVNIKNEDNDTALHIALKNGHFDIAKALIEAHADVNIKNGDNDTALHIALKNGHFDVAKALIEAHADVNIIDRNNNTYLHLVLLKGETDIDIVQKLIECGTDPNLKNDQKLKPILIAALYGHTSSIRELLNGGAKIDISDHTEISLMHLVLMESDHIMLRYVLTDEIHCNASGNNNMTVLHLAARLGCHEHVKCLLSTPGMHVNPKYEFDVTPLHCASEIGNTETVISLLNAGCKLNVLDNTGKSVLHIASIYGHCELVKLFINKHLDPSRVDTSGRNCLQFAALYRNEGVVHELLKTADKSKCNRVDSDGKRPIQYLHVCERDSLISKLLHGDSYGIDEFPLEEYHSFRPDISKCPHISEISKITYIGSVNAIKGHNMRSFIEYVQYKVREIILSAIPNSRSVEVFGVGSSFEGTKNGLPDEFDFIIKLYHVNSSSSGQEGYGKMERNEEKVKKLDIIGSYGIWLWEKLMAYWTNGDINGKTTRTDGERKFEMPLPPQRHPDRKTCTTWTWLYTGGMFKDLPVSIDFVPAIETDIGKDKMRSTWAMTDNEMKGKQCYIVPKIPHKNSALLTNLSVDDINQLGRVSYPTLEVEHLKHLEHHDYPRVKNVYVTAKCLRKPEVLQFKIKNAQGEVKAISEFVTSYRLKSVFLHLVQLFVKSKMSLGKMLLMVYEQLEKCLERDNLPMFFDPGVNVLAGSKLSTKESLPVTRMMTRFVRALYERDFSMIMEKDSEEEAKAIAMAIEMERTAPASYDEEMRIYKQKWKKWNEEDRRNRWLDRPSVDEDLEEPEEPKKPNKPVLLNTYILENLKEVLSK